MVATICTCCAREFEAQRSTARFCSDACRKDSHQKRRRGRKPENAQNSPAERHRQKVFFDTHMAVCERYYSLPPDQRASYIAQFIEAAREGCSIRKRLLTNRVLFTSDQESYRHKHWRGSRAYPTFAQEAHELCMRVYGHGSAKAIKVAEIDLSELTKVDKSSRGCLANDEVVTELQDKWDALLKRSAPPLTMKAFTNCLAAGGVSVVGTYKEEAA